MKKAVVAGASGLVGKELVQLLLDDQSYSEVTIIVRRSTGIKHPKLQETIIDFDQLEQTDVNMNEAVVYCTLGTTIKKAGSQEAFRKVDYHYPLTLGRMAKEQGAREFLIITSMGANSKSRTFYTKVKGEIEESLVALGLSALKIFHPSLLLGNRQEFRFGEWLAASVSKFLPIFMGPLRRYKPIHAKTVAKAMVRAASNGLSGIHIYESDQIAQIGEHSN